MNSTVGRLWKKWPIEAEKDGRSILRVDGKLYDRQLRRVQDDPVIGTLVARLSEIYNVPATVEAVANGDLWLFEMAPAES